MRVKLPSTDRIKLFTALSGHPQNGRALAANLQVSPRTVNGWRNGRWSMPLAAFNKLLRLSHLKADALSPKKLPDFWHIKKAASKGAMVRLERHGNFGTPEGRRRGGLASVATHLTMGTGFKTLKIIRRPKHSEQFAEFMGIMTGDGHLSDYQASMTTNSQTDKQYALFVDRLISKLFNITPTVKWIQGEHTVIVVASSKALVKYLCANGMPKGNKLRNGLRVPYWVLRRPNYQKAFLRGLFDTDGCIYVDKHKGRRKIYKHLGWTITSYAEKLIADIIAMLKNNGFSPTFRRTQKSVYLRKQKEIHRYFKEIGTHNQKHLRRYRAFNAKI